MTSAVAIQEFGCFQPSVSQERLAGLDQRQFQTLYVVLGRAARVVPQLRSQLTIRSSRVRFAASAEHRMIIALPWPLRYPA